MFGKNKNKTVGLCVMVVTACLILTALWGVLGVPGPALGAGKSGGKKGSGQGALHGCIELRDAVGDRVQSDDGGPIYCDGVDSTKRRTPRVFPFHHEGQEQRSRTALVPELRRLHGSRWRGFR